jgi:hypothetical protein
VEDEPAVHLGDLLNSVLKEALGGVTHWRHCSTVLLVGDSLASACHIPQQELSIV